MLVQSLRLIERCSARKQNTRTPGNRALVTQCVTWYFYNRAADVSAAHECKSSVPLPHRFVCALTVVATHNNR